MTTAADLLRRLAESEGRALLIGDDRWTYRELIAEGSRRAALFETLRDSGQPPHIGVLLDNVADYVFWLVAAALSGSVVAGINSTYRGDQLGQLIRHTDCQVLVTSRSLSALLDGVDTGVTDRNVLLVDEPEYAERLAALPASLPDREPAEDDLFALIFTSGSTGLPKAVRCTQGRFARTAAHMANVAELGAGDVVYSPLPFFHQTGLVTGWAGAIAAGVPLATRSKFSASGTLPDIRKFGATMLSYTGKILDYVLATPALPDDADSPLRVAFGNEASPRDIKEFSRRFGCRVRDSYGSTEGIIVIRRDSTMPEGALGRADATVKVVNPDTRRECPPAVRSPDGTLVNFDECVGELVETQSKFRFEGYYKNEQATTERFRNGWYWAGDLAYRDADGWFFFAGRTNEWLRVDGENFAAAPVEAIIRRHPLVRSVAVYAVPDDPVGDRVMVAIELRDADEFDPVEFDAFLAAQPDLGPKWLPAFVWVTDDIPKLASMKIDKSRLRKQGWHCEPVYWRPTKGERLRRLEQPDRDRIDHLAGARPT